MSAQPAADSPVLEQLLETYVERHLVRPLRRAWVKAVLKKLMAVEEIRRLLTDLKGLTDFDAVDAILQRLAFSVHYTHTERIPPRGRLLVVANHPVGAADVFVMLQCLHHVRNDVRVVINKLGPQLVPPIRRLCLPVDRYSTFDPEARSRIRAALLQDQAVILFPAGGISKLTWRGIRDHRWKHGAVHFVRDCQTNVLPVYIAGRSSLPFLCLPRNLRHFLVARDMLHPVRQRITVAVGLPVAYTMLTTGTVAAATQRLQQTVYALAKSPTALYIPKGAKK